MPRSLYVLPYKAGSKSAAALASALDVPVLRKGPESRFIPGPNKLIINWGATGGIKNTILNSAMLNGPNYVMRASDKKKFFARMKGAGLSSIIPLHWGTLNGAHSWWTEHGGGTVLARTILNGHSGAGIVELTSQDDWENFNQSCNLFVQYIKKVEEYRVHFVDFRGYGAGNNYPKVIFVQRKALKLSTPNGAPIQANHKIRNLSNGYVYVTDDGDVTFDTLPLAVQNAVNQFLSVQNLTLGLQFGALDIIYNQHYNNAYILEVNTAPGLAGATIGKYRDAFAELAANM